MIMRIKAPLSERGDDLYETPACAVYALLQTERLPPGPVWEPACGPGAIVQVLREAGHQVIATDLIDYGLGEGGKDFLKEGPRDVGCILTNPPFKLAQEFVAHALTLCPRVIMLLRLAFLESERRRPILDSGHLARVYVFRNRLPMMHRAGWDGPRASQATPFAWYVWDREHTGPTELRRISWDDFKPRLDLKRSIDAAYRAIRGRVANGGPSWRPKA
jgi:hypothetical protein